MEKHASATAQDRYGTVIHELTHLYADTDDYGYFNNPAAVQGQTIVWKNSQGIDVTNSITTEELVDNADSYAGFMEQYYYNWG